MSTSDDWAEIPRNGTLCGLKRGRLYLLAVPCKANKFKPKVRSVSLKDRPNQKTGKRLVHVPSLLSFLNSEADKQATEAAEMARQHEEGISK
jgi:hypothetical protein